MTSASVAHDKQLFWGCFVAIVATSFAFISRVLTADGWGTEFGLTATQVGEILGAGLWPFAISIILFSLVIDQIGYKTAMWFGLTCHVVSAGMILVARDYGSMYAGTVILALGNGTPAASEPGHPGREATRRCHEGAVLESPYGIEPIEPRRKRTTVREHVTTTVRAVTQHHHDIVARYQDHPGRVDGWRRVAGSHPTADGAARSRIELCANVVHGGRSIRRRQGGQLGSEFGV